MRGGVGLRDTHDGVLECFHEGVRATLLEVVAGKEHVNAVRGGAIYLWKFRVHNGDREFR